MKLTGHVLDWDNKADGFNVTDAIVTESNIALDWEEPDCTGHLKAVSPDGIHFKGIFGYPRPDPNYTFELTLYRAKEEILLFGNWYNQQDGEQGIWAFRLVPEMRTP